MRVTSTTYTNLVINSSQTSQQQLAVLQQQIASGDSVQFASDNPTSYEEAEQTQTSLSQMNAYSTAASQATTLTSANNQAMTSLHQVIAQASELATTVTTNMSASDMQNLGTQVSALLTQLTSIVNQSSPDGTYLFGGTSNQPPINSTSHTYNAATNGQGTTIDVQQGNPVQTGIVAGRSGSPPVDGFLYDSSSGIDVLKSLNKTISDLNSGNSSAVQKTDLPALDKALDHISLYVGSTASSLSAADTASEALQQQITAGDNRLNNLTQTNLPNATVQLQQIQTQYQASLEAGTRLMGLSMLNYMSSIPTT